MAIFIANLSFNQNIIIAARLVYFWQVFYVVWLALLHS
ncbi:Uncharacterised protein [Legionella gratiana]|uniref:Uncharacterized protein n=1 Tax=Legionella gratiana TaxID=45066 RepID=A0A378JC30_9GAMM|nr:Uncharacterised protein [Legionella gratiana]